MRLKYIGKKMAHGVFTTILLVRRTIVIRVTDSKRNIFSRKSIRSRKYWDRNEIQKVQKGVVFQKLQRACAYLFREERRQGSSKKDFLLRKAL